MPTIIFDCDDIASASNGSTGANEPLIVECPTITGKAFRKYRSKLDLLSTIHNEIAPALNAKREAIELGMYMQDSAYIPATTDNDLLSLMVTCNQKPIDDAKAVNVLNLP